MMTWIKIAIPTMVEHIKAIPENTEDRTFILDCTSARMPVTTARKAVNETFFPLIMAQPLEDANQADHICHEYYETNGYIGNPGEKIYLVIQQHCEENCC